MVERFRRMTDLDGVPRVEIGTVAGFLDRLGQQADDLPVWAGELYLEAHRATLTTHAEVKLANRRAEEALRAAELWSVAASFDRRPDLDRAWKLLLFHQFHDILPGSSIHWVYEDTAREQAEVLAIAGSVTIRGPDCRGRGRRGRGRRGRGRRGRRPGRSTRPPPTGPRWSNCPTARWPWCRHQRVAGRWSRPTGRSAAREPVTVGEGWLDNGLLRVEWDGDGLLTSVRDIVADRQVLADHERGNLFQLHDDHPRAFDAWDVDRSYLEQVTDLVAVDSVEVVERHPLRSGVRFIRSFGDLEHHPDDAPLRRVTAARVPHRRGMARAAPVPQSGLSRLCPLHRAPPTRSSTATSNGRPSPTPAGTRPASKCAVTDGLI